MTCQQRRRASLNRQFRTDLPEEFAPRHSGSYRRNQALVRVAAVREVICIELRGSVGHRLDNFGAARYRNTVQTESGAAEQVTGSCTERTLPAVRTNIARSANSPADRRLPSGLGEQLKTGQL